MVLILVGPRWERFGCEMKKGFFSLLPIEREETFFFMLPSVFLLLKVLYILCILLHEEFLKYTSNC